MVQKKQFNWLEKSEVQNEEEVIKMNTISRTAYILQIHKNPEQVNKFINQLISEGNADVFVHIDKRSYETMYEQIVKSPFVKVLQESVTCEWGDISQVDATILLLKEVIASKNNYDFVCLRSGQDLLVKDGFKDYLMNNQDKVFLKYRQLSGEELGFMNIHWPKLTRRRYTTAHPIRIYRRILLSLYKKGINLSPNSIKLPNDYLFYKGSQWFTIPFEVAEYIINFLNKNEWYFKFFENSLVPDESFFHTLIMNSPYKNNVVNNNLMYVKWGETLSERNSPQYLKSSDIQIIEQSNQFFARKFDVNIDSTIIDYFTKKVLFHSEGKAKQNEELLI
jgi:hypothetical protein